MSRNRHHCSVNRKLVLAISLGVSVHSLAAEIEEVEVIGREVNLVGSASSASEGRVSHEEIELRPLLRTGEVLEAVPGLVATQHSGSGKANQFFLRGFNLDHGTDFATYIDGMPVNMRTHGHGQGYTDLNFMIPEMVEELTYRKGSYYADVGDFSGAGSARILTADHLENSVSVGMGEHGFMRALLLGSGEVMDGRLLYGAEKQAYDGPWDDIDEDVDKTSVWLKQLWENGEDSFSLTFMAYDNQWNSADQIPARAVSQGLITPFGSVNTSVGGESSRYSLAANWKRQLGSGNLSGAAYVIDYDMTLWSDFTYFIEPEGDQFQQQDDRRIYGGRLDWLQEAEIGGMQTSHVIGVEYRFDDIDEVGLSRTQQRMFLDHIRLDRVEEWSLGLYWQNTLHWSDAFRTVAGVRYDYYDFSVDALQAADPATTAPNSGAASDDIVTASLSAIYTLNEQYEVYASIGQGFHSNDARGTTISFDPVTAEPVEPVDPLVNTLGSEIGIRAFLTDRLNASVSLWHLDIDSELIFVGDAGNTEDTGVGSERTGIEFTAYYQFSPQWALDLEYAATDARFKEEVDGSDDIPSALDNVFSGGLSYNTGHAFSAYLRVRHFGDYPLDSGATADSSTMLNLRLGYGFTEQLKLTVDLLNLLDSDDHDVEYFYESQLAGESMPVADHHYHVFEPRTVRAYLKYTF